MMNGRNAVVFPDGNRVGSVLAGKWRLERLVGRGLVGNVYEANDRADGRVAICVLRDELLLDGELRDGFVSAARAADKVRHADRVQVLGDGLTDDQHPFIVTELLEGETVAKLIHRRRGRLYPAEALRLVRDALDMLDAAHEIGLVHGELRPERLFVMDSGTVKVLGFGVSALRQRAAEVLGLGAVPGVAAYLAPEQARHGTVNAQSDLFALGAVLFTLLTGAAVHEGNTDSERRDSARVRSARSLAHFAPAAPPSLVRLLERALAPEPEQRFPNARAMHTAVDQALMLPELLNLRSLMDATPVFGSGAPPRHATPPATSRPPGGHAAVHVAERAALHAGLRGGTADTVPAFASVTTSEAAPGSACDVANAPGESEMDGLHELFAQLGRALQARVAYGAGHADATREAATLYERAGELLAHTRAAIYWDVNERGFTAAGRDVWQPEGDLARVPVRLFADGVRRVALLPGLERSEIDRLLDILDFDELSREDDLVTLLWHADLPHIMRHAVRPFANPEAQARFEHERHQTLALVRFDTRLQLEDCWRDARGDTSPAEWRQSLPLVLGRRRNEDGQTFAGGRAALSVGLAEREATAARLASEDRATPARFTAVLARVEETVQQRLDLDRDPTPALVEPDKDARGTLPCLPPDGASPLDVEGVLGLYACAVTTVAGFYESLSSGASPPVVRLRQVAQCLTSASVSHSQMLRAIVSLAGAQREPPARAVQSAVLVLLVAREVTGDRATLSRLAEAALIADAGRARLGNATGGSFPEHLEAQVPASTVAACLSSDCQIDDTVRVRTTVAFETTWLERDALLGPLRTSAMGPLFGARLLVMVRALLERLAPARGGEGTAPPDALCGVARMPGSDPVLVRLLVAALGALPVGTVVELDTGEWAVVSGPPADATRFDQPQVRVVTDTQGRAREHLVELDLATGPRGSLPSIERVIPPDKAHFNVAAALFA